MTAALKLVPENDEVDAIAGEMAEATRELMRRARTPDDVLPPGGVPRYDDLANARRFLAVLGHDMLYCPEKKKWLIWQETHWQDDREDMIFDLAANFAASLYAEADDKEAFRNATRANNRSGFNAFIELAARDRTLSIDAFDEQEATGYMLNCRNGTLDLRTGELREHRRDDRITRVVNCDYVPDARSEVFERFITRIQPDDAVRGFLQRSIGYSLLGTVRERSFWILYGTGNNGKSVFTSLFQNLLGDYASSTPAASIMLRGGQASGSNANPDIARLKGKRFVVIPETEENERIHASLIKALAAGDTVTARFLFGEFFDFQFTGKLWIATNHKPTITDHSKGFWDRLKVIPFREDIPASEVIKMDDLMRQLMAEREAVLAWAVQGARDYFEADGLSVPPEIQREIDAYKFEQDSIAQFLENSCETLEQARRQRPDDYLIEANYRVGNTELYKAYERYCKENGEFVFKHARLSRKLTEKGFRQLNSGGRYWEGIRLIETSGIL